MWQKCWVIIQQTIQETINYRFELLIWICLDTVPTLVLFFVWQSVFRQTAQIQGYTFSTMAEFYFYFLVISNLTSAHFEKRHVERIRLGQIDKYLVRPLSFPDYVFWGFIGSKLFYATLLIPSLFLVALAAQYFFQISFSTFDLLKISQFGLLLLVSFAIEYLIAFLIVLLGFWFEGAEGLEHFKWIVITLLGGSIIPKEFMPTWLRALVDLTPFQYMYSIPIAVIQGRYSLHFMELLPVFAFIGGLILLTQFLWRKAIYKYTSAGG